MRVTVISDTHLPCGERRLPEACVEAIRSADLVLHAGDLVSLAFLAELRRLGPPSRPSTGTWILNPGSPTERRRAPARSWLELTVREGAIGRRLVGVP